MPRDFLRAFLAFRPNVPLAYALGNCQPLRRAACVVQRDINFALLVHHGDAVAVAALKRDVLAAVPAEAVADQVEAFKVRRVREGERTVRAEKVAPALVHPPGEEFLLLHLQARTRKP